MMNHLTSKKQLFSAVSVLLILPLSLAGCRAAGSNEAVQIESPVSHEEVGENGNVEVASESNFLSISKSDTGDLVITIIDDEITSLEEKAEKLASSSDNMYTWEKKDAVFDISFYGSEKIAEVQYADIADFQSSIAELVVYPYGSEFSDFVTTEDSSSHGNSWEYRVDRYETGFRIENDTLTITFRGAGDLLNDTKAYTCNRHHDDDSWELASASIFIESISGEQVAGADPSDAGLNVRFIDDNTVYITLYDDALSEETEEYYYRVNFTDEKDSAEENPFGRYFLETRFNDPKTYPVSMLSENRLISETAQERTFEMVQLDYYVEDNGSPEYPRRAAAGNWYGDAEVYDGYLNMSFSYKDLRDELAQYDYVCVVKGGNQESEVLAWYSFDEVADLEDYDPYQSETIEPLREEYVRPFDDGIFEPETPYYSVLSSEIYGPVANGMAWTPIKDGMGYYPAPPFVGAWGFRPEIDTERYGHAISTLLESYDEFGNLVQSVVRFEYDTVEDLQWSYIPWNKIYYPYYEYGVDEPNMEYVNPEYYEISREETLEKVAADAVCLGVYENYIYYDLIGIHYGLERYGSCFDRFNVTHVIEDYWSDGSSESFFEAGLHPFEYTAVIPEGNVDDSWPYENSTEIRVDLIRNDSIYYVPNDGAESQAASFVHDTTCKLDSIGGYMGFVYGEAPAGYMKGYSHVRELRRVLNFIPD